MIKKIQLTILLMSVMSLQAVAQKKKNARDKNTAPKVVTYPCSLNGETDGYQDGYIVFFPVLNQAKKDTVKVVGGKFTYQTKIEEATAFNYVRHDGQSALFFMDTGSHNFIIDYKGNKGFGITNSPTQESYNKFGETLNPYFDARMQFQNQYSDSAMQIKAAIENNIQSLFNSYLKDTLSAPASVAFLTLSNVEQSKGNANDIMEQMYSKIPPKAQAHAFGKRARKLLDLFSADDLGKIAPDFKLKTQDGKEVALSSFRGKNYVLVDFWATWCGPCRAEFPALMEAQKKYADKGLVILGVSIDADSSKWYKFVTDPSKTNWTHVWDGPPGPDQVSSALYSVPSIPRNFLLDKNGKVIARNLRGAAVEQELKKVLEP
jgi:thiol-disulfide isomerase/thioredoxin